MDKNSLVSEQSREQLKANGALAKVLCLMPKDIQDSFTVEQLKSLQEAMAGSRWKKHAIDLRSSISFFSYRYYYVFIAGRDQRQMTRQEIRIKRVTYLLFTVVFLSFSTLLGMLVLYLIKSAMGIDIFPNFSFGIWGWFKALFH